MGRRAPTRPPRSPDSIRFARVQRATAPCAERRLWYFLRDRRLRGWKFRRQHPVGPFVLDFYCAAAGVAVELDGEQHARAVAYDARRSAYLATRGIRVIRFWNNDVLCRVDSVLEAILLALGENGTPHP